MPGYGMHGGGYGLMFGLGGFIVTLLVIAAIVLLIVALTKRDKNVVAGRPAPQPPVAVPPSQQILDDRLARGDISVADYQARKAALLGHTSVTTAEPPVESSPPEDAASEDSPKA